jgi:hypothetical protein
MSQLANQQKAKLVGGEINTVICMLQNVVCTKLVGSSYNNNPFEKNEK